MNNVNHLKDGTISRSVIECQISMLEKALKLNENNEKLLMKLIDFGSLIWE